jgi:hypothetical protein
VTCAQWTTSGVREGLWTCRCRCGHPSGLSAGSTGSDDSGRWR